jgi:hypothetical protein
MDWNIKARTLLKVELTQRDIKYRQLSEMLAAIGVHETERSIANKISRGTFSMAFFLQVMKAIGVRQIDL